jgi:four helix bundle protein
MDELKHRNLEVWKRAIALAEQIYKITKSFPADERFALTDQIRRAVISVPSNIAEGSGRQTPKDFANFLSIARGSLAEIDAQLVVAQRLGYVSDIIVVTDEIVQLSKMLNAFITTLRSKI